MSQPKVWFITGAGRGVGFEILKAVLETGDKVVATVRSHAQALADKLGNPEQLEVVVLDVTDDQQAVLAAKQAEKKFGKIDVLVNNAGYGLLSAVEEATAEEVRRNFETNVFGTLNVTRAILPYMRGRRSGHIINISSVGGLSGYMGWGVYGSTKFAIEGLTESLAMELAPLGIHVTVVAPGFFRTEFLDASSLTRSDNIIPDYEETVGKMRKFATQVNKRQPGDPVKLAKAFIQLANSENPPVHLPLGNDSLQRYREKTSNFEKDIEAWYEVITGTDHDDVSFKE
ncbi:NAD(P)-dependent dehydrogenase (short-subunit alcohol dehydrogenase family) [Paenibacillus rhizosphaerae]|uniref:NAD(P)-dependent dehydrogenase (Short-subunit alcohol dehydrogenase family) n=1 Tax=Paenibacillus rhizosphaerae TaxID=297318 RepID=A0A839TPG3_9BACL|nr:oxidoreductase [Paenibacillus rhizosphaerae]MBB3128461.1 NAD(P)-dependent dehydrogenase (short-subunit alcohol dehydrogenase family) [Paenibacillus rhizosphaerae]